MGFFLRDSLTLLHAALPIQQRLYLTPEGVELAGDCLHFWDQGRKVRDGFCVRAGSEFQDEGCGA
jgi:hypothetical protein